MSNDPTTAGTDSALSRRNFLRSATGTLAAATLSGAAIAQSQSKPNQQNAVDLPPINNTQTEAPEKAPGPFLPRDKRIGYAIVGLGRLSLDEILPAFGSSNYCKAAALVSGDRTKALKVAAQ